MISHTANLPQFVRDLLASPPPRGGGLNNWFYRVARVLHPYRDSAEIIEVLRAAAAGEPVKHGEIERAVERSKATAWQPGIAPQSAAQTPPWPKFNIEQHEAAITSGAGLVDLWEISPVRFADNKPHAEEIIDVLFPGDPLLCAGKSHFDFETRSRSEWLSELAGPASYRAKPDDSTNRAPPRRERISAHARNYRAAPVFSDRTR
jgi:hypothetical protein